MKGAKYSAKDAGSLIYEWSFGIKPVGFGLGSTLEETNGTLEEMSDLTRMSPRCECGDGIVLV